MANSGYSTVEIRFIIEPELLQVYVRLEPIGDCPIGVQGWHHKTYPGSVAVADVMDHWRTNEPEHDPVLWPLNAPPQ